MINRLNTLVPPSVSSGYPSLPLPGNNGGNFSNGMSNLGYPSLPGLPGLNTLSNTQNPLPLPEINTEADLAMFNQFMISLGRDTANTNLPAIPPISMAHAPSFGQASAGSALSTGSSNSPLSDQSPIEDLFAPDELASLGLAGMPGIPSAPAPTSTSQVQFGGLYPTLDHGRARATSAADISDLSRRTIASLPRANSQSQILPKSDFNPSYPDLSGFNADFSFDSLARTKSTMPATLAPREFYKKTYRHVAPLGASLSSRLHESAERTAFEDEDYDEPDEMDVETPKISVRSLLADDSTLTLPAIDHPDVEDGEARPTLPSIASALNPRPPVKRHTEDEIVRGVKRLELRDGFAPSPSPAPEDRTRASRSARESVSGDSRRRHAALIRAWLVAVNLEWRKKRLSEISEASDGEEGSSHLDEVEDDDDEDDR
jgi:hypothetical protein